MSGLNFKRFNNSSILCKFLGRDLVLTGTAERNFTGGGTALGGSRNFQNLCICSSEVAYCKAWVLVKGSVEILNKNFEKAK